MRLTEEQYAAHNQRLRTAKPLVVPEREVLAQVLEALALCPLVAWAHRMNTGAMKIDERFVRFSFKGCSDVIGQLTDGRFLAVECKRQGEDPTEDQAAFLALVNSNRGLAFVARCPEDVFAQLGRLRVEAKP